MLNISGPEMFWLLMTVIMTALMWIPYILNRIVELGVLSAIWDPQGHTRANAAWANRMMSAHANAIENLVIFAPLVLLVVITQSANQQTAIAVQIYFGARLLHFLVFTFAVPVLRVVTFLTGFAAQAILVLQLI
jgi:uncharacterized MAPEG superfamily protein